VKNETCDHSRSPIILQSQVGAFRGPGILLLPLRIVPHEKIQPDRPRHAHQNGLQQHQEDGVDAHPPEQPVVVEGHADEHFPGNETGHTNGDSQRIADEARPIPKTYFDLEGLAANGAVFIHLHHMLKIIRIVMDIKIALAAAGAFIGQDAAEQTGPMVMGNIFCTHDVIDLNDPFCNNSTKVLVRDGYKVVLIKA